MRTPEGFEKDDICKFLDANGVWYFRPFMAGYGKSGVADILCCIKGRFAAIEVKRFGKGLTKLQERRLQEITAAGGIGFWGTAEKVIAELQAYLNSGWTPEAGSSPSNA